MNELIITTSHADPVCIVNIPVGTVEQAPSRVASFIASGFTSGIASAITSRGSCPAFRINLSLVVFVMLAGLYYIILIDLLQQLQQRSVHGARMHIPTEYDRFNA